MVFRRIIVIAAASFLSLPEVVHGQSWPVKPVRVIVPNAAGSGVDIVARYFTDRLSRGIGQPVIVDNRAGGNSVIGAQAAATSPADGYSFLITTTGLLVNEFTMKQLPYDLMRDFASVSVLATGPLVLVSNAKLPVTTLADLTRLSANQPAKLSLSYEGAFIQATASFLIQMLGVAPLMVPYSNPVQAMQNTVNGTTQLHLQGIPLVLPFIRRGDLRPLAVTTAARIKAMPEVPSITETHPAFGNVTAWMMLSAPAATPADLVGRMSAEMDRICKMDEVKAWLDNVGNVPEGGSPQSAAEFLRAQMAQFARMASVAGLQKE